MADGYQISDSLKTLSLEKIVGGRKTDQIQFRMVTGTVAGFRAENITEVSGGGVSVAGGGSTFLDKQQIKPIQASASPIHSTNRRKCVLWVTSDDGAELQIQFESEDIAFREGQVVRVLCGSTSGNDVYYLRVVNENTDEVHTVGEIPMSAVLAFGAKPLFGLGFYVGASCFFALLAAAIVFFNGGENARLVGAMVLLLFFGLRFYLMYRRESVRGAIARRGAEIGGDLGKYTAEHER